MSPEPVLILSCEHGGNRIPPACSARFARHQALLDSHRGWDPGALEMAVYLQRRTGAPLHAATISRLLIDLNRSPGHPQLYGPPVQNLSPARKDAIRLAYYVPYRRRLQRRIEHLLPHHRPVVHLSVHSFTPSLNGRKRNADVGLLYDPSRPLEVAFCDTLAHQLRQREPALRVRRNSPYRGTADGLTRTFRRTFAPDDYLGIELEINQAFPLKQKPGWPALQRSLGQALAAALATLCHNRLPEDIDRLIPDF